MISVEFKRSTALKDAYTKDMQEATEQIESLKQLLDEATNKLPKQNEKTNRNSPQKDIFEALLKEKKTLVANKRDLFDQIKNIQSNLRVKNDEIKNKKDKLKSSQQLDLDIKALELQLASGGISLLEGCNFLP
jgi:uncharacterized phage infection (PIP) family protein YhgE